MDSAEAQAFLADVLTEYRSKSFQELKALLGRPQVSKRRGASGAEYHIEIEPHWDGRPDGDIRVRGTIDDGGLRAFVPLIDDFIMAPNGRFVGE